MQHNAQETQPRCARSSTRAWAELVGTLSLNALRKATPEMLQQIEQALQRIEELAPGSGDHLYAQAFCTYYVLKDYETALGIVKQAQAMVPSDIRLVELTSWIQRGLTD